MPTGMTICFSARTFSRFDRRIRGTTRAPGLWLLGHGDGTFRALKPSESGVRVYGEQRGAALADFDRDGRVDLVVTQNAAATRLFRNQAETKGVRVSFGGEGEGVQARLVYADGTKGPVRVVQSITQVLGAAKVAVEVEVAWPSARKTRVPLKPGQTEVVLTYPSEP